MSEREMADSFVGATQVGSFFVQQYYQILQQQPDYAHRFYTDSSSVVRVDGDTTRSASALQQIHAITLSLNYAAIEIKTINSLDSWTGGIIVVVSGSVNCKGGSGWRKFLQTFFLAPQEKGYFVLNDIFHFVDEEVNDEPPVSGESEMNHQAPEPIAEENEFDSQSNSYIPLHEQPVSDYALEVEDRENENLVHLDEGDPVENYTFQVHEQEQNPESEKVEDGASLDHSSILLQSDEDTTQESLPVVEEPADNAPRTSYASILRASKANPKTAAIIHPSFNDKASQPALQQSNPVVSVVPVVSEVVVEESSSQKEGDSTSIYVRNLPPGVSTLEVLEEFKNFGGIKQDGVFVNNRTEIGVCYAFIEFENVASAHKAVKASPIKFSGRQVYVEFRRSSASSTFRGGRMRRGRSSQPRVTNIVQGKQTGLH